MNDAMLEAMFDKFGKVFQPNEILFCEYEPGNDFYLIKEGKVKVGGPPVTPIEDIMVPFTSKYLALLAV